MIVFGAVPSRRLGRSLGVNNIPPKICSYSCVYCQLGKTFQMSIDRQTFYEPEKILSEVNIKLRMLSGEIIDYLSFVPDGEPTLDVNLGKTITLLRSLGIKIAVITNGSLIFRDDVKEDLAEANLVSLKIDAITENVWRRINRPHKFFKLDDILEGILDFAAKFDGKIISETMLIKGINDNEKEIDQIKNYLVKLNPEKAYLAIPTRPPAHEWIIPADEQTVNIAYQIFNETLGKDKTELLISEEATSFSFSGNIEDDLLSITSVHPMREDAVENLLRKAKTDQNIIDKLIREDKLIKLKYGEHNFYMRKIPSRL